MSFLSNIDIEDWLKTGVETWSEDQQRKSDADTAAKAIEIERLKIQQLLAEKALEEQKANTALTTGANVKAYIVPIAVVGVLVIGGIGAYFFFKKKKMS